MYSASNPADARRTDGMAGMAPWAFIGAGIFIILSSAVSLVISIALIAFGIILFRQGRADRAAAGESQGFFTDLFSLVTRARAGEIDPDATAAGQSGGAQGSGEHALAGLGGFGGFGGTDNAPSQPQPEAPASGPPAGWYIDPEDNSLMRWWDGQSWGSQKQPREGG